MASLAAHTASRPPGRVCVAAASSAIIVPASHFDVNALTLYVPPPLAAASCTAATPPAPSVYSRKTTPRTAFFFSFPVMLKNLWRNGCARETRPCVSLERDKPRVLSNSGCYRDATGRGTSWLQISRFCSEKTGDT